MAVRWEATDQFGNLYVGNSDAYDLDGLRADLGSMIDEVVQRRSTGVKFSIDLEYGEISAPEGGQVSHLMNVAWLADRVNAGEATEQVFAETSEILQDLINQDTRIDATVQGPWDA
jgi:hypothetical protein